MPESIRNMITRHATVLHAYRMMNLQPSTPVQAAAPVVDENSIRAQVLAEQKRV